VPTLTEHKKALKRLVKKASELSEKTILLINLIITKPLIYIFSKPKKKTRKARSYSTKLRTIKKPTKKRKNKKSRKQKGTKLRFLPWILYKVTHWEIKIKLFSFKTLFLILILSASYIISVYYLAILKELPSPNQLLRHDSKLTTNIYDRKGNVLYKIYLDEDREMIELKDIPQDLINATISIEDHSFFEHKGISFRGIIRAAKRTLFEDDLEGGSTITQQLVKNTLLSNQKNERTIERKIKEALIAIHVELKFSKEDILQMYLNEIPYGGTAYGIQSAAHKYFDKDAKDLDLAESALLAGLPAAPSVFSPLLNTPSVAKARQKDVLNQMVLQGYITKEEAESAFDEKLVYKAQATPMKFPHFVNYVKGKLSEKYGQQLVDQGGLQVYTSIDPELQTMLEKVVASNVKKLAKNNVTNGAALITNPKTGEILAMVGSQNYWDKKNDGEVNVTISERQPGSSIKPLMYSLAFENGYTPYSIINDSPITYKIEGQKPYTPRNYDNKFHGKVTITKALANSYNVPAVKLLDKLGIDNFINHARKLGITTWNKTGTYGLSLTLGAGEVRMIDMASAYGVFANNGKKIDITPILKTYDSFGNILDSNKCVDLKEEDTILTKKALFEAKAADKDEYSGFQKANYCLGKQVISPESAYWITSILSNNKNRTPAFGANSALNVKAKPVAVKTGTTQNLKDNWAIGYLGDYVVVTWIGNNDGEAMKNVVSGYRGASNIWREAIDYLIANREIPDKIEIPDSLVEVRICPLTNTLACDGCPNVLSLYKKGTEPKRHCTKEEIDRILQSKEENK